MMGLENLGGFSRGFSVNNSDHVTGSSVVDANGNEHAFLWHDGTLDDLGVIGGAVTSHGLDINNLGDVVGTLVFDLNNGELNHGFLYRDGMMIDVNTLLPPGSGWVLRDAQAINDVGQIVGFGIINGQRHAYLLFPGDFNGNGKVDGADYVVWRKNDGTQIGYNTWRTNFGRTTASGSSFNAAIPEPSTLALLCIAAIGLVNRRKRK
jgi:probable HAF family extracellular repeat protein